MQIAAKPAIKLPRLKTFPESELENRVRGGDAAVVRGCATHIRKWLKKPDARTRALLDLRISGHQRLVHVVEMVLNILKDLRDYLEMHQKEKKKQNDAAFVEKMVNAAGREGLLSEIGKLLANLGMTRSAFLVLHSIGYCCNRIGDVLSAALVAIRLHSSGLAAIRYLIRFPTKGPVEQVLILLRAVRLLAFIGHLRSAFDLARIVIGATKGSLRKNAVDAVAAIRKQYLDPVVSNGSNLQFVHIS
ncbi:hypothetical protein SAMN06265795_11419 [Noviherbaspirillum humi]|uniref:Uncharacterized protein n=1 Tax=Noviherbaspirillum humi TaxID=1688639 RepID=A0A239K025_9BURK|nr:hypothetical protein [Noviherbaspirillum humi]SNT10384.1 hypothetical protein SAMN06265795_11419 [Noviherbaspirillum humi]